MNLDWWAALGAGRGPRRSVAWLGGIFIAAIIGLALFDSVRSHREAVESTGRELDAQARVIAEQTARSLQAVDVVLRHLAEQYRAGAFDRLDGEALHALLREQAIGLVQADGISLHDAQGRTLALSWVYPTPPSAASAADRAAFKAMRDDPHGDLLIGDAVRSRIDRSEFFPIVRRLSDAAGDFAGTVSARGRIAYFQEFYRDAQPDPATKVTLMHRSGTLIARHPPVAAALGQRFPLLDEMVAAAASGLTPTRTVSPVDGVERYGAVRLVPDYPLVVIVTRDADAALAPWRAQATGSLLRTLALAVVTALLLAAVLRQLARLSATRESLETSRERYALAAAGSDDGIWDWNYATGQAFASQRAREILGMPGGAELQSIDDWFVQMAQRMHPEDLPLRNAALEAHFAGQTPAYEGEWRVLHPDGSFRWIRVRGVCVRDAAGRPQRIAGSVSDIDARQRAVAALSESEERFALAVAGSNDGVLDWDIVHDRMFTSPRAMRIAGVEADGLVRTRAEWTALLKIHPDDVQRHADDFRRHLEGGTEVREGDYRVRHPDGAYRWVRVRGMSVRDAAGRAIRWAGSVSDIDAQKRTEEALRRSEERYQLAVEGSNEGLWDWDLDSDMLFLSPRAQELVWLDPGEPLRPRRYWIERTVYHPDDVRPVQQAISDHLRGRTPLFVVEYRLRHHSGVWHWYRQRGVAVRDAAGRPYRMAGSMENISARKNAEAARDRLELQLRQAQKLEAIGTLAGGIAHDFNNILAAILGYGELAQKDAPEGSAQRRHIDAALSAGMRAKSLVERILAFSRSGMGERVPVHVQSVVAEALDGVAASLPHGVRLVRQLDAGDAGLLGDPTQIHQVVMNLCANAVQAMKAEGVLTVSAGVDELAEPRPVATSVLAPGRYLRLSVADTGAGIPPPLLERIFDPFFTTKEVGVGTGLGLSLVHGIVTDLGGGIAVESRPGEGALFTVYLPWQRHVPAPAVAAEAIVPGAGETVLLVDDEEALVRLGEETLAELGYEPVGFSSSAAALESFKADPERFQAVLSDEAMPGLTGSELVAEIRRLRPAIPIVLMSGFVSPALVARARESGVAEVLVKPLVARDIARSLANALHPGAN